MIRDTTPPLGDDASQDSFSEDTGNCTIPRLFPNGAIMYRPDMDCSNSGFVGQLPVSPTAPDNGSFTRAQFADDDGDGQLLLHDYVPGSAQFTLPEGTYWRPAKHHLALNAASGKWTPHKYLDHERAVTWAEEQTRSEACATLADQMRRYLLDAACPALPSMKVQDTWDKLQEGAIAAASARRRDHHVAMIPDSLTPSSELLTQYRLWWRREKLAGRATLPASASLNTVDPQYSLPLSPLSPLTAVCRVVSNDSESGYLTTSLENNNNSSSLAARFQPLQSAFSAQVSLPTALYHHSLFDDEPQRDATPAPLLQPQPPPNMPSLSRAETSGSTSGPSGLLLPTLPASKSASMNPSTNPSRNPSRNPSKPSTPLRQRSQRPSVVPSLNHSPLMAGASLPWPPGEAERRPSAVSAKKQPTLTVPMTNDSFHSCNAVPSSGEAVDAPLTQRFFMLEPREPLSSGTAEPLQGSEYRARTAPRPEARYSTGGTTSAPSHGSTEHHSPISGKGRFSQFLRLFAPSSREDNSMFEPGTRIVGSATAGHSSPPNRSHFGESSPPPPSGAPDILGRRRSIQNESTSSAVNAASSPTAADYSPVTQTLTYSHQGPSPSNSAPDFFHLRSMQSM